PIFVQIHREQRHDETRSTKPALRAMVIDHRLLRRMQTTIRRLQMFNGQQLTAVENRHEQNTSVDGAIIQAPVAIDSTDNHSAGTTVALCAALFRAAQVFIFTQPLQYGLRWINVRQFTQLVVQKESYWSHSFTPAGARAIHVLIISIA